MNFDEIWSITSAGSILGPYKSKVLYAELISTEQISGVMAEIGVFRGQTAHLMHLAAPSRKLYLYDTFQGIVKADKSFEWVDDGMFCESADTVRKRIGEENIIYRVGMFPETFTEDKETFSFVHSDTDTYFGTTQSLVYILPRLSPGGKLLFDDYRNLLTPGVTRAINEYKFSSQFEVKDLGDQFLVIGR